jgi:hypothetical protein
MRLAVPKKFTNGISGKKGHLLGAAGAHSLSPPRNNGGSRQLCTNHADLIFERRFGAATVCDG